MTDSNRRQELEALLAVLQQPGHAVPSQELIEYLRLVSLRSQASVPCQHDLGPLQYAAVPPVC